MFYPVTKYVLSCRSLATTIYAVASIVRKISFTVSIKSTGAPVHCFGATATITWKPCRTHFCQHRCDFIFDQSARSIFAHCEALVVACDANKQLTVSQTLVFEIKNCSVFYCSARILHNKKDISWSLGVMKFLSSC